MLEQLQQLYSIFKGIVYDELPESLMEEQEKKGVGNFIKTWINKIRKWMQPDPADHPLLQLVKFTFKCFALLLLIAFSPVILVVLLFVFLVAI